MGYHKAHTDEPPRVADLLAGVLGKEWKRLHRHGGSLVLALSPSVRRFLRVDVGDALSLLFTPRGTVELVPDARGEHLPPRETDYSARLIALERENRRLRRQLRARPLKIYNEAFGQGFLRGLAVSFADLHTDLAAHLRDLAARPMSTPTRPRSFPRSTSGGAVASEGETLQATPGDNTPASAGTANAPR